jgi:hypothetical protein
LILTGAFLDFLDFFGFAFTVEGRFFRTGGRLTAFRFAAGRLADRRLVGEFLTTFRLAAFFADFFFFFIRGSLPE